MEFKSPAKINLFLNVGKKREDSFHDLISIMIRVSFFDRIYIKPQKEFRLEAPGWIPQKENLVYRAAKIFFKETGIKNGCNIRLEKNIPPGSGLGGGSSNAATTLKALNIIYKAGLSVNELESMGSKLGSDVNFFLYETGCLVAGRGEYIKPLNKTNKKKYKILLVDPGCNISTKNIYENYPGGRLTAESELNKIINKYRDEDWPAILRNDLENTVFKIYPGLRDLKNHLENRGLHALLSGSGSFVFAFSKDSETINFVKKSIKQNFGFNTYIVEAF